MIQLTGIATSTAVVAGCGGGGGGGEGGNGGEEGNGGEGGNETEGGNGGENGGESGGEAIEIEPGTDIRFEGQTSAWIGLEPSEIADEENPTISLQEGEDYTIGWTEGDGAGHNIEIRDDSDEVVDDLSTEVATEADDSQILDITASSEMAQYVCQPHETQMVGDIEVGGGGGGGGDGGDTGGENESEGNESEGNESEE